MWGASVNAEFATDSRVRPLESERPPIRAIATLSGEFAWMPGWHAPNRRTAGSDDRANPYPFGTCFECPLKRFVPLEGRRFSAGRP